jgi:hypothetical protein
MTNRTFLDALVDAGLTQDKANAAKEKGARSVAAIAKNERARLAEANTPTGDSPEYDEGDALTVQIVNKLMCKVSALNIKYENAKDSYMYTPDYIDNLVTDLIKANDALDRELIDYYLLFPDQLEIALKKFYEDKELTNSPLLSKVKCLDTFIEDYYAYYDLVTRDACYSDYLSYIIDTLEK